MENSFFASPWDPLRHAYHPRPQPRWTPPEAKPKPKVVSIPIHFVGSGREEPEKPTAAERAAAAAVRIQKAFRGFLVRRNLEVVRNISAAADEMERKIAAGEERIRGDARERLRVGEMLMALLLRLDSVRGVRDYRKKVIRRVIKLQEKVDAIAADQEIGEAAAEACDISDEKKSEPIEPTVVGKDDPKEKEESNAADPVEESPDSASIEREKEPVLAEDSTLEGPERSKVIAAENVGKTGELSVLPIEMEGESGEGVDEANGENKGATLEDVMEQKALQASEEAKKVEEDAAFPNPTEEGIPEIFTEHMEAVEDAKEEKKDAAFVEEQESSEITTEPMEEIVENGAQAKPGRSSAEEAGMKEVMEKVVAESERLKGLVAELCERSAQQCRVMGGLAERVEHLERAVRRMEKKKRRKASCSLTASTEKKPN